jgi:salicylate hydroxylase
VVFAVTMDRNHDLIPPNTCRLVYGPGHKHFGSYGLGSDCSWFVTVGRPSSSDSWGPVSDAAAIEAVKEELSVKFKGWSFVERMLEREVAVMIRVSRCACTVLPGRALVCV